MSTAVSASPSSATIAAGAGASAGGAADAGSAALGDPFESFGGGGNPLSPKSRRAHHARSRDFPRLPHHEDPIDAADSDIVSGGGVSDDADTDGDGSALDTADEGGRAAPRRGRVVRVLTFNVFGGGANQGNSVRDTVRAIMASRADVVGLQETRMEHPDGDCDYCPPVGPSVAPSIAKALGFHCHDQTADNAGCWANAVISRWPIVAVAPNDLAVTIAVPPDGEATTAEGAQRPPVPLIMCNIHLDDSPYQPSQLLRQPYGDHPFLDTAEAAERSAALTRGEGMALAQSDIEHAVAKATEGTAEGAAMRPPVVVTGDFNEPSHLDWTEETAARGTHPMAVAWPQSRLLHKWGFCDALRTVHPDPCEKPAFSWNVMSEEGDVEDHHDRIDFVYVRDANVINARVVGEKHPQADLVVTPWPSDHRACVAKLRLPLPESLGLV